MAGDDDDLVAQREVLFFDRGDLLVVVPLPEVGAADAAGEQGVAGEQGAGALEFGEEEAAGAGGVAGGVNHLSLQGAGLQGVAVD